MYAMGKLLKIPGKRKTVPSNNPYLYCNVVCPILESQKVQREEISQLQCRSMHGIHAMSIKTKENDNLYAIYGSEISHSLEFVCKWLHLFLLSYQGFFEVRGEFYLCTKGMFFDLWQKAVNDG